MKWPFREPSKFTDWVVAFAAVVGVFVALMQIHILALQTDIIGQQRKEMERQRDEMAGQRKEMANAGKQTDRIIAEDRRLADANEKVARGMTDSVSQAKLATNKSLDQSRKSLEATIEMSRNDQRAWVGITSISGPKAIKEESPFNINAIWGNFGKSPAFKVTCATGLRVQARRDTFEPVYEKDTNALPSSAILWPSLTMSAAPDRPLYFDKQRTDDIRSGRQIIRAYGYATYEDAFGRHHRTEFACSYTPDDGGWRVLDTHNTAD